ARAAASASARACAVRFEANRRASALARGQAGTAGTTTRAAARRQRRSCAVLVALATSWWSSETTHSSGGAAAEIAAEAAENGAAEQQEGEAPGGEEIKVWQADREIQDGVEVGGGQAIGAEQEGEGEQRADQALEHALQEQRQPDQDLGGAAEA